MNGESGYSTFTPAGSACHEHWCAACNDVWAHNDASCEAPGKPYDADSAYECPEHQPRSGYYYESYVGVSSGS